MTPEKQIYDADQARLVLENEQFQQAFTDIEQEIWQAWKNSPARDEEGRRELFRLLKTSEKFKVMLQSRLATGQLAGLELEQQRQQETQSRAQGIDTTGWSSLYSGTL